MALSSSAFQANAIHVKRKVRFSDLREHTSGIVLAKSSCFWFVIDSWLFPGKPPPSDAFSLPRRETNVQFKKKGDSAGRLDLAHYDAFAILAILTTAAGEGCYVDYGSSNTFLKMLCFCFSFDNSIESSCLVKVFIEGTFSFRTTLWHGAHNQKRRYRFYQFTV